LLRYTLQSSDGGTQHDKRCQSSRWAKGLFMQTAAVHTFSAWDNLTPCQLEDVDLCVRRCLLHFSHRSTTARLPQHTSASDLVQVYSPVRHFPCLSLASGLELYGSEASLRSLNCLKLHDAFTAEQSHLLRQTHSTIFQHGFRMGDVQCSTAPFCKGYWVCSRGSIRNTTGSIASRNACGTNISPHVRNWRR
jgi:hypothetical protein